MGLTPTDVARRRQLARAMLVSMMTGRPDLESTDVDSLAQDACEFAARADEAIAAYPFDGAGAGPDDDAKPDFPQPEDPPGHRDDGW